MNFMKVWDTVTIFMYICLSKRPCQHIYNQECDIICDWSRVLLPVIGQEYYFLWWVKSIAIWDWSRVSLSVIGQEYYNFLCFSIDPHSISITVVQISMSSIYYSKWYLMSGEMVIKEPGPFYHCFISLVKIDFLCYF